MSIAKPVSRGRGLLLAAALGVAPAASAATLYDLYAPGGGPGPGPRGATSLWRVTVTGGRWGARCADGTDPVIYVRKAPAGPHANDWVFHIPGGGSGTDPDVLLEQWSRGAHRELSSRWADESKRDDGIFDAHPLNPFHDWNVVSIDKCTMDRFLGTRYLTLTTTRDIVTPAGTVPAQTGYEMWFQGALFLEDAFERLAAGNVSYTDRSGALITMPSLSAAGTILWTGTSGGSKGALMAADGLRARAFPAAADVKLVVEAGFYPGAELLLDLQGHGWASGSIYDGAYGFDPQSGTASDVAYDTVTRETFETWGADSVIDQSCLYAHLSEQWKCYDEAHVLMNHVAMPFFVRQDLYDDNHLSPCWQVEWRANEGDCYLPAASRLEEARRHATAVQWQLEDLARFPADHDEGVFTATPIGFGPRCGQHVGLTNDAAFLRQGITDPSTGVEVTFAGALDAWVRGVGVTLIERSALDRNLPATCQ